MLKRIWSAFPKLVVFLVTLTIVDAGSHVTLSELLTSINKIVDYYADNYRVMNLDGIMGLRAMEGTY